jgi:hypothetical protein
MELNYIVSICFAFYRKDGGTTMIKMEGGTGDSEVARYEGWKA